MLEHPEASHAWARFGLNAPPRKGGWIAADFQGGWTCCVEQGHYGHRGRKATWLYLVGAPPPSLRWGPAGARLRMEAGFNSREHRERHKQSGLPACPRMGRDDRIGTPIPFRDLLLDIARQVTRHETPADGPATILRA